MMFVKFLFLGLVFWTSICFAQGLNFEKVVDPINGISYESPPYYSAKALPHGFLITDMKSFILI
ncbi:MAG: hypothetical protein NZ900_09650, partial [Synergistetes bacterium]|nr:hypothetical protein [Synergistota bacterium]MDW8193178.1 hypothetical protein [Synergistota bacterium]